jgi:hypothetical protein
MMECIEEGSERKLSPKSQKVKHWAASSSSWGSDGALELTS